MMWDSLYMNLCLKTFLTSILKPKILVHTQGMHAHALCMRAHTLSRRLHTRVCIRMLRVFFAHFLYQIIIQVKVL